MSGITPEQLAEWRSRAEAATPGPWAVHVRRIDMDGVRTEDGVSLVVDAVEYDPDAPFIAVAREAVPALIAEVERLQAEMQLMHQRVSVHMHRVEAGEAEAERLRGKVKEIAEAAYDVHHRWRDERDERIRLEERLKVAEARVIEAEATMRSAFDAEAENEDAWRSESVRVVELQAQLAAHEAAICATCGHHRDAHDTVYFGACWHSSDSGPCKCQTFIPRGGAA